MYEWYLDKRDDFINMVIRFLLKHCGLHAPTVRLFITKVSPLVLKLYSEEYWKKEKNT